MSVLEEYKFNSVYELADLIDKSVEYEVDFWNFNPDYFISAATNFSKDTLLHLYIAVTAMNHYRREFRKNGDLIDEESINQWYSLFNEHSIKINKFEFDNENEIFDWFEENESKFKDLFDKMADEVFYILFSNRKFLLKLNNLIAETIKGSRLSEEFLSIPKTLLTNKGTIKRTAIPQWVKKAIFHRDKGRCVFCNTDLTGVVNTLTNVNYDHIVPLDLFGANDPCNIQLTCERCNKTKKNKTGSTGLKYIPWWTK